MKKQPKRKNTKKKVSIPKKGNISDLKTRKLLYIPISKLILIDCNSCSGKKCWDCFFTGKELVEPIKCNNCNGTGEANSKAHKEFVLGFKIIFDIFGNTDGKLYNKFKPPKREKMCSSCLGRGIRYKYPYAARSSFENTFKEKQ